MFTAILSFLGGPVIGSIIGAFTGYFNRKLDIDLKKEEMAQRRLDREHERSMRQLDIQLAAQEAKGKAEVAVIEGNTTVETERMRSIAAAYEADKVQGPPDLVDKLRRSVRPVLSYVLTIAALAVNFVLLAKLGAVWETMPEDKRTEIMFVGVLWVLTQASAALSFWFVSRPSEFAPPKRD